MAAAGDENRIEHHVFRRMLGQLRGDGLDVFRRADHADLHRIDADVGENGVDLRRDEIGGNHLHRLDAERVLRRQRAQDRHAIAAERRKRLDVALAAGAAGRIGAGDRENMGRIVHKDS